MLPLWTCANVLGDEKGRMDCLRSFKSALPNWNGHGPELLDRPLLMSTAPPLMRAITRPWRQLRNGAPPMRRHRANTRARRTVSLPPPL